MSIAGSWSSTRYVAYWESSLSATASLIYAWASYRHPSWKRISSPTFNVTFRLALLLWTTNFRMICVTCSKSECFNASLPLTHFKMFFDRISLYDMYLSQICITFLLHACPSSIWYVGHKREHPTSKHTVKWVHVRIRELSSFQHIRRQSDMYTGST